MPRPTKVVKYLLIINIAVYVVDLLLDRKLMIVFAAAGRPVEVAVQVWRLVTFQFLHAGTFHLLFNMIGLYFLGPTLEQSWGSKKFLAFYLICGAVGGLLYVVTSAAGLFGEDPFPLVGASGGVLGLLVACAILFPHFVIILLFFPVPIRFAAILLTIVYVLSILGGESNAGGDLCHLGGMATGFIWVMGRGNLASWRVKRQQGAFRRKQEEQTKLQYELDRILAKVHEQGIQSLTRREKEILRRATENQKRG